MSQWGKERTFVSGSAAIRVVPDVEGPAFAPLAGHHRIAELIMVSDGGCNGRSLFEQVKQEWVGRRYSEWQTPNQVEEAKDILLDHYSGMVREIKEILRAYDRGLENASQPLVPLAALDAIEHIKRVLSYKIAEKE